MSTQIIVEAEISILRGMEVAPGALFGYLRSRGLVMGDASGGVMSVLTRFNRIKELHEGYRYSLDHIQIHHTRQAASTVIYSYWKTGEVFSNLEEFNLRHVWYLYQDTVGDYNISCPYWWMGQNILRFLAYDVRKVDQECSFEVFATNLGATGLLIVATMGSIYHYPTNI